MTATTTDSECVAVSRSAVQSEGRRTGRMWPALAMTAGLLLVPGPVAILVAEFPQQMSLDTPSGPPSAPRHTPPGDSRRQGTSRRDSGRER